MRLVLNTTETGTSAVVQQIDYDASGNVTNLVDPDCTAPAKAKARDEALARAEAADLLTSLDDEDEEDDAVANVAARA